MVILEPCETEILGADAVIKLVVLMKSKPLSPDLASAKEPAIEQPTKEPVAPAKKPEKTPRQKELIMKARDIISQDEVKKKIIIERIKARGKAKITQLSEEEIEEVMKDV